MSHEELRATLKSMRARAVGDFQRGVSGLLSIIRDEAHKLESAIGEVTVDEAWCALAHIVTETLADDVAQYRRNTKTEAPRPALEGETLRAAVEKLRDEYRRRAAEQSGTELSRVWDLQHAYDGFADRLSALLDAVPVAPPTPTWEEIRKLPSPWVPRILSGFMLCDWCAAKVKMPYTPADGYTDIDHPQNGCLWARAHASAVEAPRVAASQRQ